MAKRKAKTAARPLEAFAFQWADDGKLAPYGIATRRSEVAAMWGDFVKRGDGRIVRVRVTPTAKATN
jgi:hypothetical protein